MRRKTLVEQFGFTEEEIQGTAIIMQARMSSSRFPGKSMEPICAMPLVEFVAERCRRAFGGEVVVATSVEGADDVIYKLCLEKSIKVSRGSLNNVLARYLEAAELYGAERVIRICGDSPFFDISAMYKALRTLIDMELDYAGVEQKGYPGGFISEVLTVESLRKVAGNAVEKDHLEHVTKYITDNPGDFKIGYIDPGIKTDLADKFKLTVDEPDDIKIARAILDVMEEQYMFTSHEVIEALEEIKDSYDLR